MNVTNEQYQKALEVLREAAPMQLQRQDKKTGEWRNVGACVRGQEAAYEAFHAFKDKVPKAILRVLPKNQADKYREGVAHGRKLDPDAEVDRPSPRRSPMAGMYMPDNL